MANGARIQFSSHTNIQWEWAHGSEQIRLLEPEDRIVIARRGRGGKNFFALETLVSCLRGETRVWQADFELNSHWGGIRDDEVIAGMQVIAQKAGIGLEVRDILIEPEPQNPAGT